MKTSGFTIIEILAAMAVTGVAISMAFTGYLFTTKTSHNITQLKDEQIGLLSSFCRLQSDLFIHGDNIIRYNRDASFVQIPEVYYEKSTDSNYLQRIQANRRESIPFKDILYVSEGNIAVVVQLMGEEPDTIRISY